MFDDIFNIGTQLLEIGFYWQNTIYIYLVLQIKEIKNCQKIRELF